MGKSLSVDRRYGSIFIQLEKPKYLAGEQINGWIHLSLIKPFPSNCLYLIISGKEKVRLVSTTTTVDAEHKQQTQVFVHKDTNEFYAHTFPVYTHPGTYFMPGQYSFPFSFRLAENMPGSFCHEYISHGEKCFGKTKYRIKAGMKDPASSNSLFEKISFVVDQRWELPSGPQSRQYSKQLQGYCYSDLGHFDLTCYFDKDKFVVGENSALTIAVDNSNCSSDVNHLKCQLIQIIRLQTSDNVHHDTVRKVLTELMLTGVQRGEKKIGVDAIPIMLPIRTESDNEASSNGNLIRNEFKVSILADMDACICNGEIPHAEIDIKIFNRQPQPYVFQPQVPNWNPTVMDAFVCTISPQSRMTQDFKNQIYIDPNVQYPPMA